MSDTNEFGERRKECRYGAIAPVFLAFSIVSLLTWDYSVSRWFVVEAPKSDVWKYVLDGVGLFELIRLEVVAIAVVCCVRVFDRRGKKFTGGLSCSFCAVYLLSLTIKSCVVRYRPSLFFQDQFALANSTIWNTFGGIRPGGNVSALEQSFPSGHSSLACAIAMVLICLYPKWKYPVIAAAFTVMFQRVVSGSHFSSDVFFGAFLAVPIIATMFLNKAAP